jgi:hypothetical protein
MEHLDNKRIHRLDFSSMQDVKQARENSAIFETPQLYDASG